MNKKEGFSFLTRIPSVEPEPLELGVSEETKTVEERMVESEPFPDIEGVPVVGPFDPKETVVEFDDGGVREVSLVFQGEKEEEKEKIWPPCYSEDVSVEEEPENSTERDGLFFYRIKATMGITLNGTHYPLGGNWFESEEIRNTVKIIDAPFQDEE